jgi:probable F420-dependent oxidoreductase
MAAVLPSGRLVYGMQLPVQSQSTIYVEPWEADAGPDELGAIARAADEAGFWYLAVCDHIAIPKDRAEAMGTTWWDTVATLGWLAGITRSTRLLSHVYVPAYRHPLAVAKAFSTLDAISGGRVVMGVGAGHVETEFEMLGLDFSRRGALLDEAIDALRTAFGDEFTDLDGPSWPNVGRELGQRPRPVQPGGPPIWVGGSSKPALRRAAERGDGWLPQGPVTAETVDFIRRHRQEVRGDEPIDIGALIGEVYVGSPTWDVGPRCLSGEPGKIAHVVSKLHAIGVGQVQVRLRSRSVTEMLDQIAVFGAEVAPLLPGHDG